MLLVESSRKNVGFISKRLRQSGHVQNIEIEDREGGYSDAIIIPQDDGSGVSDSGSESEFENCQISENEIPKISYHQVLIR